MNLGPLEEQLVLLNAKPSPQPPNDLFTSSWPPLQPLWTHPSNTSNPIPPGPVCVVCASFCPMLLACTSPWLFTEACLIRPRGEFTIASLPLPSFLPLLTRVQVMCSGKCSSGPGRNDAFVGDLGHTGALFAQRWHPLPSAPDGQCKVLSAEPGVFWGSSPAVSGKGGPPLH